MNGIILTSLAVAGPGRPLASIDFADGLNVVAGASDTGKSYLLSLIDYAFGATDAPRPIQAAVGYTEVIAQFRSREGGERHVIKRLFGAGRVTFETLDHNGVAIDRRNIPARHSPPGQDSLSSRLLSISGFSPDTLVRTNSHGATRRLSFRDIAYLCFVDEARIIAERPPFRSASYVEHTVRREVLRLVATGMTSAEPGAPTPVARRMDNSVRREVLISLIANAEAELDEDGRDTTEVQARLRDLEQALNEALTEHESSGIEAQNVEQRIARHLRELREADGRLVVSEGLVHRFALLADHYQSDIARLETISEAADLLALLPFETCPICGSTTEHHRPDVVHEGMSLESVRASSDAELAKTQQLLHDLDPVLARVNGEVEQDQQGVTERRAAVEADDRLLKEVLAPRLRATKGRIESLATEREHLVRHLAQLDNIRQLRERLDEVTSAPPAEPDTEAPETLSQALRPFTDEVLALLAAWRMPGADEVHFSEASMDLIIGGEPRASHGKGVRALTCAAFILGLARNAAVHRLPHLGIVALDTPLVAYREPDSEERGTGQLIAADVKGSFYRSLAAGLAGVQTIVFENEDPPADAVTNITYVHFSKGAAGRYGFLPTG